MGNQSGIDLSSPVFVMPETEGYQDKARRIVFDYVKPRLEITDTHITFKPEDVYVVWFCRTLQNWKAMLSTTFPDGMYYEVTYDGDRHVSYVDSYKKWNNVAVYDIPEG